MKRLVTLLILLFVATPGFADTKTGPGTAAVKQANEKIDALLKQKVTPGSKEEKELSAKVTTSVRDFLDIDALGKLAMADQWSKLSPAQQQEFLTTLRSLIEDNYVRGLRSNLEFTVDYTGESRQLRVEGNKFGPAFLLSIVLIFLILAAQSVLGILLPRDKRIMRQINRPPGTDNGKGLLQGRNEAGLQCCQAAARKLQSSDNMHIHPRIMVDGLGLHPGGLRPHHPPG